MISLPTEEVTSVTSLIPFIHAFFDYVEQNNIALYNEFSFQHEMGIYLRSSLPDYQVQFERNVSFFTGEKNTVKKEIDISIFSPDMKERYAIELKFPVNGQYPEQLYSFVKDIKFMEQLKSLGFQHTYCVSLVADRPFFTMAQITKAFISIFVKRIKFMAASINPPVLPKTLTKLS